MTTWLTESQALDHLGLPPECAKRLTYARYRKKVRSTKILGVVQYDKDSLDYLRESKATEEKCEASQNSSGAMILPIGSSTSQKRENSERSALIRAKQIHAKQNSFSRSGYSKDENPNSHR